MLNNYINANIKVNRKDSEYPINHDSLSQTITTNVRLYITTNVAISRR